MVYSYWRIPYIYIYIKEKRQKEIWIQKISFKINMSNIFSS